MKELVFSGNRANTAKIYETGGEKANDQLINNHDITILIHFVIFLNAKNKYLISLLAG